MDNLNNGKVVEFSQIKDYQKAAKDFAEGNRELEQLLLNCFNRGIKTVACCGGHEDQDRSPYISFLYSTENKQLIYAILSKLKDHEFNFRYNKLSNGKSYFSIEESGSFHFSKTSTLFNDINNIIHSFDFEKNYYSELPIDLQKYGSIIENAENDEFLKMDGTSGYFQMCYEKLHDEYEYSLLTSDPYYNRVAEEANFTKVSTMEIFSGYDLRVSNREMAIQSLNEIATKFQTFGNKKTKKLNEEELKIGFEFDEKTRSNPFISHLKVNLGDSIEIVAQKLGVCRKKGISAFAVFNGIEVNNYMSDNPQKIIEMYNQKSKLTEMKKVLSQNQYEQNQQNLSDKREQDEPNKQDTQQGDMKR